MGLRGMKLNIGRSQSYLEILTHNIEVLTDYDIAWPSETCQQSWADGIGPSSSGTGRSTLTSSELKGSNRVSGLDG